MLTKTTKALIAALVLASASIAMSADSWAAPRGNGYGAYQGQDAYMQERHDPTNTNGF